MFTAVLLKLGQTRVFISPMGPKITQKREKWEREREREKKKRLAIVFIFSVWTLECWMPLTDSYSERPDFHNPSIFKLVNHSLAARDLKAAFLVFFQHPAWVYHAGKLIDKVFYCFYEITMIRVCEERTLL